MSVMRSLDPIKILFREYRDSAKARGHSFELEAQEFRALVSSPCHYCGETPAPRSRVIRGTNPRVVGFLAHGVDRVNSTLGYSLSNCVTCCQTCNSMKSNLDVDAWLDQVKKIAGYTASQFPNSERPASFSTQPESLRTAAPGAELAGEGKTPPGPTHPLAK